MAKWRISNRQSANGSVRSENNGNGEKASEAAASMACSSICESSWRESNQWQYQIERRRGVAK